MKEGVLYLVVRFPKPWPSADFSLISQESNGTHVQLFACADGHLRFEISGEGAGVRCFEFQRIRISGGGETIITAVWNETGVRLRLNSSDLKQLSDANGAIFELKTKERAAINMLPLKPKITAVLSPEECFFFDTLQDIQEKLAVSTRYSLIRSSGLLRQLLIDGEPLIHRINRRYHLKIEFEIVEPSSLPILPEVDWQNLLAAGFPKAKRIRVNLERLLNTNFLRCNSFDYTVKDLIKTCANIMGGIHHITPDTKEQSLLDLDKAIEMAGEIPSLKALKAIVTIVLNGLLPLVNAIEQNAEAR
jgi:hypothetical protein